MKCWNCGTEATRTRQEYYSKTSNGREIKPNRFHRCFCEDCLRKVEIQEAKDNAEYIRLKKQRMFLKACWILENQHTDMYEFREAIDAVQEYLSENEDKFDSSYEVVAAIVLIHDRIHLRPQEKVGKYQVDFMLPELYVILEIDGERHKYKQSYDRKRDNEIKARLGPLWEIIRVNTSYLDQNAKALPKAIYKVLEQRKVY